MAEEETKDSLDPAVGTSRSLSERTLLLLRVFAPHTGLSPEEITATGIAGYVRYLQATHAYIRASVPLMIDARERFSVLRQSVIVDYLDQHIEEELGHDVWTIEDLEVNGLDSSTSAVELIPEIAAACGAQYYHIRHGNPWLFFAYVYCLESSPPSSRLITYMREATGLPDSAFRTLQAHQDLDVTHSARLAELIDTFQLSAAAELAFERNALTSATQVHVGVRRALALAA